MKKQISVVSEGIPMVLHIDLKVDKEYLRENEEQNYTTIAEVTAKTMDVVMELLDVLVY